MVCQSCLDAIRDFMPGMSEDEAEELAPQVGCEVVDHYCDSDDCICNCGSRD